MPRWVVLLWMLVVMAPYITFTWMDQILANPIVRGKLFFEVARFFMPWLFPLVTMAVATLARLPRWATLGLVVLYGSGALWFYFHTMSVL